MNKGKEVRITLTLDQTGLETLIQDLLSMSPGSKWKRITLSSKLEIQLGKRVRVEGIIKNLNNWIERRT